MLMLLVVYLRLLEFLNALAVVVLGADVATIDLRSRLLLLHISDYRFVLHNGLFVLVWVVVPLREGADVATLTSGGVTTGDVVYRLVTMVILVNILIYLFLVISNLVQG